MNCSGFPNNKRHAYLFLAYKNTYVLEKTLRLIDDERNDIYIHVDLKSNISDFEIYRGIVKKSNLYFTKRINCHWAAFSQLNATLILLEEASKNHYAYYHLLSESCMPLKTQNEIHSELAQCKYDYIETKDVTFNTEKWNRYYYFLTENRFYRTSKLIKGLSRIIFIIPQKLVGIDRWKNCKNQFGEKIAPQWGWNWFSLRDETVSFLLSKKEFIKKHFKRTHCPDECCIPTMLFNFTDMKQVKNSKRNIVFDGKPSVLTVDDYDRIMQSDDFFARKFDENKDRDVIDRVFNSLKGEANDK